MAGATNDWPPTVAESAAGIRDLLATGDMPYVFRALIQVADNLADAGPELRAELAATPPATTGHDDADAFLAAIVEYRLIAVDLPCPAWVDEHHPTWHTRAVPASRRAHPRGPTS